MHANQQLGARSRSDEAQLPRNFHTHFTEERAGLERGGLPPMRTYFQARLGRNPRATGAQGGS